MSKTTFESAKLHHKILLLKSPLGKEIGLHVESLEVAEVQGATLDDFQNWSQSSKSAPFLAASDSQTLMINITQLCNLACAYCEAGGNGTYGNPKRSIEVAPTIEKFKQLFQQSAEGSEVQIVFFGGEPMMYLETLSELADAALLLAAGKPFSLIFKVITNGTLITEKAVELLQRIKAHVQVSLDGPKDVHDANRSSSFLQTESGLQKLIAGKRGLSSLEINAVYANGTHEAIDILNYLASLDIDRFDLQFEYHLSDTVAQRKYIEGFAAFATQCIAVGDEQALRRCKYFDRVFDQLDEKFAVARGCEAGRNLNAVDAQNQVHACPWLANQTSNNGRYPKNLSQSQNCQTCWAQNLCGGGCGYAHSIEAFKNSTDSLYCERVRSNLTSAIGAYADLRSL